MSVFEHDDRVRREGDAFRIPGPPNHDRLVIFSPELGWCCYEGPGLTMLGCQYATSDDAIRSLIGEPAVTA